MRGIVVECLCDSYLVFIRNLILFFDLLLFCFFLTNNGFYSFIVVCCINIMNMKDVQVLLQT
jgi:hypothetical protein